MPCEQAHQQFPISIKNFAGPSGVFDAGSTDDTLEALAKISILANILSLFLMHSVARIGLQGNKDVFQIFI